MQRLSQSGFQCARDCKRKFLYRYEWGLQRRQAASTALRFGKLWHYILATWFELRDAEMVSVEIGRKADSMDDARRCQAMFAGYVQRWPDVPVMTLSEQEIDARIRNPNTGWPSRRFSQFGFLDMLALHDDGKIWLWEHKTATRIDGVYLEKLWTDSQVTGYFAALRDMGIQVEGVIYDIAQKPALRPRKNEADADFYDRVEQWHLDTPTAYHREQLYISDRQVQEWREDLWDTTQEILTARRTGRWYRNTGRCTDFFRMCEYAPLCQNGPTEALISAEFEKRETPADNHNNDRNTPAF